MFLNYIKILAIVGTVKSAKILVVAPTPAKSHQVVFRSLIQELLNRNHEVTAIVTDAVCPRGGSPKNFSEINLHDLSYMIWNKMRKNKKSLDVDDLTRMRLAYGAFTEIFLQQLNELSVLTVLNNTTVKFDLVIIATAVPATLIFSHIFKAPVIFMSSFGALPGNTKMIGANPHPILYPTHYQQKLYNLSIWEKACALYTDTAYKNMHEELERHDHIVLKSRFGTDTPTLNDLKNNVHMLFLNVHPIWIHNQPVPQTAVYIWGVHKPLEKVLTQELQSYLDSSIHGVIYMSFGSIFKTTNFSLEMLQVFLKTFSKLPYDILWKWDTDELPGKSKNIKISKWFPQYDILKHPKLKLFITHGGLQSTHEAISAGVPLIGIPQFSDQEYNTEKYEYFKIGIKLDSKSLTIGKFERAIETILTNYDSYKKNIIHLRTIMYDQPKPALEQVIWRIEYLLRHGGVQHLRAPAANMSWVEYYELELVLLIFTGLFVLGTVFLIILRTCLLNVLSIVNHHVVIKQIKML